MIKFKITGDARIDKMFTSLPKKVQNKILREEIKKAAKPMAKLAKSYAPVDEEGDHPGLLRRAIKERAMKRRRNYQGRSILVDPKYLVDEQGQGMRKYVAGGFMEYGTKFVNDQTYMRAAFDGLVAATKRRAISNIKQRIEAEATK